MGWTEEVIGDCRLILGNSIEIAPTLPEQCAIVSDPPYGIRYQGIGTPKGKWKSHEWPMIVGDDQDFDPTPWAYYPEVLLWGATHFASTLPQGRWLVWNKLGFFLDAFDNFSDVEIAWCKGPGNDRVFHHRWKGVLRDSQNGEPRYHPNEKPIALFIWCLQFIQSPLVLDPYMGSASTGLACLALGKRFIGIEICEQYWQTACTRLDAAHRQGRLFAPPVPAPQQQALALGGTR